MKKAIRNKDLSEHTDWENHQITVGRSIEEPVKLTKVTVWFSIGVCMKVENPDDYVEIAEKGRSLVLTRIREDGISDCIEAVDIDEE